jgi:hypothetical protein
LYVVTAVTANINDRKMAESKLIGTPVKLRLPV